MGIDQCDGVKLSGKRPTDWAEYRGPQRDGVVSALGPDLARDWQTKPPRLLWQHPIGGGHSSFAVADKALFTLEQRRRRRRAAGDFDIDRDIAQLFIDNPQPAE